MNNNQYAGLKKESAENDQRCFEKLAAARGIHKDTVIFDATIGDDGEVKYTFYTYEGETLLQKRAEVYVKQPNIYDLVVSLCGGTMVSVLTDEENMPSWVYTHGEPIPANTDEDNDAEETDDYLEQLFDGHQQRATGPGPRELFRNAVNAILGGDELSGPVTRTEAGIAYTFDFLDEEAGYYVKIFDGHQLSEYAKYLACPLHVTILVDVGTCQWDHSQLRNHEPPLITLLGEHEKTD